MEQPMKIEKILLKIDWNKIHDYHKKLNILWDVENKNGAVETKIPEIVDIKDELNSLLIYMFESELDYISYGNWLILLENDDESTSEVRVIFRLADYVFTKSKSESHIPFDNTEEKIEYLESKLDCAVENEDYETAAIIRDEIHKIDKKD